MTNLSQWFDLAEQKPWGIGTYEVETQRGTIGYSYWCGVRFNWVTQDKSGSKEYFDTGYTHGLGKVVIKWRGLSTNPEVKKKQGNRKVTRHVVIDRGGFIDKPVAVFSSKKLAEKYGSNLFAATVKTIRFRTPE